MILSEAASIQIENEVETSSPVGTPLSFPPNMVRATCFGHCCPHRSPPG